MAAERSALNVAQVDVPSAFVPCPVSLLDGLSEAQWAEMQQMYELALERAIEQSQARARSPWNYPIAFSSN